MFARYQGVVLVHLAKALLPAPELARESSIHFKNRRTGSSVNSDSDQ
jgi:hypothetical protein